MSSTMHNAIIITSWSRQAIEMAHEAARKQGLNPTPTSVPEANGYMSFLIPPDGGAEGRRISYLGDERRRDYRLWLRTARHGERGSLPLDWVEVRFGNDGWNEKEPPATVVESRWAGLIPAPDSGHYCHHCHMISKDDAVATHEVILHRKLRSDESMVRIFICTTHAKAYRDMGLEGQRS